MNLTRRALLACVVIAGCALPAHAALTTIYKVLGVFDNGGGGHSGVATVIHCSNITNGAVRVRVQVRNRDGSLVADHITAIAAQRTNTFGTKSTFTFAEDAVLLTGTVNQGHATILADKPEAVVCAADLLDAANFPPTFMAPRRLITYPRATNGGED